jgi:hypothetical protein
MGYVVLTRWGNTEKQPDEARLREVLSELDRRDPEHPDTWLTHDSGWTLTVYENGLMVWENPETADLPRHMVNVSRKESLKLWTKLANGEIDAIEQESWKSGYGSPMSAEERITLGREVAANQSAADRKFYEVLGQERADFACQHEDCRRGAIHQSVLCRVHHFENVLRRPCPFSE